MSHSINIKTAVFLPHFLAGDDVRHQDACHSVSYAVSNVPAGSIKFNRGVFDVKLFIGNLSDLASYCFFVFLIGAVS